MYAHWQERWNFGLTKMSTPKQVKHNKEGWGGILGWATCIFWVKVWSGALYLKAHWGNTYISYRGTRMTEIV